MPELDRLRSLCIPCSSRRAAIGAVPSGRSVTLRSPRSVKLEHLLADDVGRPSQNTGLVAVVVLLLCGLFFFFFGATLVLLSTTGTTAKMGPVARRVSVFSHSVSLDAKIVKMCSGVHCSVWRARFSAAPDSRLALPSMMVFLWMLSFRLGHVGGTSGRRPIASRELQSGLRDTREHVQAAKITTEDAEKSSREFVRRENGTAAASQLGGPWGKDRQSCPR